jgi:hypothetical protein
LPRHDLCNVADDLASKRRRTVPSCESMSRRAWALVVIAQERRQTDALTVMLDPYDECPVVRVMWAPYTRKRDSNDGGYKMRAGYEMHADALPFNRRCLSVVAA